MAGISLVSPPPGQPFDILTQQAQLQKAQELAYALLAKELGGNEPPTIRTAAGNPFGRDVVNLAPLGNVGAAYLTNKRLTGPGGINEQQQALADQVLHRYQEGIQRVFSPSLPNGASSVMGTQPPTPMQVFERSVSEQDPRIQAMGGSLLKAWGEMAPKVMQAKVDLGKDFKASTVDQAFDPSGLLPTLRMGALSRLPKYIDTSRTAGTITAVENPEEGLGAPTPAGAPPGVSGVTQQAPNVKSVSVAPPANPVIAPGDTYTDNTGTHKNTTGLPLQQNPVTHLYAPIPEAAIAPPAKQADWWQNHLGAKFDSLNDQVNTIPRMMQVVNLAKRAMLGGAASVRTEAMQLALQLGMTKDEISAVPSTQSLIALLLPHAAAGSKDISPRVSQQVFEKVAEASGAHTDVDPRHIVDIAGNNIGQIMTDVYRHNSVDIPAARQSDLQQAADRYKIPFPKLDLPADSPIHIKRQGNSFINEGLTSPRPFGQAGGYPIKTIGDKTYIQRGGKWYVGEQQSLSLEE